MPSRTAIAFKQAGPLFERWRNQLLYRLTAPQFVIAGLLLAALVYFAQIWEVLANTRLLDFLIRVGVIKYHDKMVGFIEGVADHKY
ncbi:MAG: hypothetical protein ACE5E2_05040, partial [Candidatus Binatia bacterium]